MKGTIWQRISQISIILTSEVGGKPSILLMKMVVITSMVVRFTLKAASKKKGLKKVVAKVIAVRRRVGKYIVIISLVIFLFITTTMLIPCFPFRRVLFSKLQLMIWKIGISVPCVTVSWRGKRVTLALSKLPIAMSIEQV